MKKEEFIEKSQAVHGDKLEYLFEGDVIYKTKVAMRCKNHGEDFTQTIGNHLKGKIGCKACTYEKRKASRIMPGEEFVERVEKSYGGNILVNPEEYSGNGVRVTAYCKTHDKYFEAIPNTMFLGQEVCPECFFDKYGYYKSTNKSQFIEKAISVHGNKYDYSRVDYVNMNTRVKITCTIHDKEFLQLPSRHAKGQTGCTACSIEKYSMSNTTPLKEIIKRIQIKNGDNIEYLSGYKNMYSDFWLHCKKHNIDFLTTPTDSINRGFTCPRCSEDAGYFRSMLTPAEMVRRAVVVYGDKYDYSQVVDAGDSEPVWLHCKEHDQWFETKMYMHTKHRSGCKKCDHSKVSIPEKELNSFVESLVGSENVFSSDRKIVAPYELDVVVPSHKLAIEFNGNYYHSDKIKHKSYHKMKSDMAREAGYSLIHVWEHHWSDGNKRTIIKELIKNRLGVSQQDSVRASKCEVVEIKNDEFIPFCDQHHIQGSVKKSSVILGLKYQGQLCAVCSFSKLKDREYSLTRFCADRKVQGGISRIIKNFEKMNLADKIVTFSDTQHFNGDVYEKVGFVKDKEIPADYTVWHPLHGTWHKFLWRRATIPLRLAEIGKGHLKFDPKTDPRTEWQMQDEVSAYRLWDAGKIKWVKYL